MGTGAHRMDTRWARAKIHRRGKKELDKEFEPKLRILHFRLNRISEDDRKIPSVCHKLRCEAFHRAHLRPQILEHVCKLLYQTVADVTVKLPVKVYSIPGGEVYKDSAAFLERFALQSAYNLGTYEREGKLRGKLVENIAFDTAQFARALSADLFQRIDETVDGLAYVGETDDRAKIDHNLKYTQFWRELGAKLLKNGIYEPQLGEEFKAWQAAGGAKFTLSKIERWRRVALAIARISSPASALDHYWAIDKRFIPLEQDVAEAVCRYDDEINMRVHDRR